LSSLFKAVPVFGFPSLVIGAAFFFELLMTVQAEFTEAQQGSCTTQAQLPAILSRAGELDEFQRVLPALFRIHPVTLARPPRRLMLDHLAVPNQIGEHLHQ
jgi:hypothetical protein